MAPFMSGTGFNNLNVAFPFNLHVERLYIYGIQYFPPRRVENIAWSEILRPLTAAKDLYACRKFAECIAPPGKSSSRRG